MVTNSAQIAFETWWTVDGRHYDYGDQYGAAEGAYLDAYAEGAKAMRERVLENEDSLGWVDVETIRALPTEEKGT